MKRLVFLLLCSMVCNAQSRYPETLFTAPLDIPVIPSGTFGELRSNHFHSGIDIKTQQREGLPVYAAADGYVSRIKIGHWGFGKVLYVNHPEGYTTVYAHLQKFSPEIEAYVKKRQYEKETYEIELFPESDELVVRKKDLIAYTGNTGSSGGPHLHFEVRKRSDQEPLNPLLFGLDVKDSKPPTVNGVYAYALSDSAQVNQSGKPLQLYLKQQKENEFLADTLYAGGAIGFGIDVYDMQDLTYNKNGIYTLEMTVNDSLYLNYDFESFSFDESPYINTLIDYEHYAASGQRIQRCFVLPYNKLGIYKKKINNGILTVKDSASYTVLIKARDFKHNESLVRIPVIGKKQPVLYKKELPVTGNYLNAAVENNYDLGAVKVSFPADTFYDDFYIDLKDNGDGTYGIHHKGVPARKSFTLRFDVSNYSLEERKKLFIAQLNNHNDSIYTDTEKEGSVFTARTRNLGTYTLASDNEPPVVRPKNFKDKQWLSNYSRLALEIRDTISGIKNYRATLNGKWVLMEYEPKTNTLVYNFSDNVIKEGAKHLLEVTVTDNVGNYTIFTSTFYRKY